MAHLENLRTYVGVPMRVRGETIGVLSVYDDQERQLMTQPKGEPGR